jgi:membrane protein involved in colicin uptake
MGQTASQCKPCSSADPTADTVKVNPDLAEGIKQEEPAQEEEVDQEELRRGQEAEEKSRQEAEDKRLREEQLEKERLQAEQERRRAEEEEARRQAEMASRKAEEEEAERQRVEALRLEEEARKKLAQEQEEIAAAQKAVDDFLKAHGFKQLSLPKKAICGAPLSAIHMAVEKNNPDLVRAMVCCGADLNQKGPSKKNPLEFAEQCNRDGSHDEVIKALRREN